MASNDVQSRHLLLVEGQDEKRFFDAMLKNIGRGDVQVLDIAGKTKLSSNLQALVRARGFSQVTSIGVVRDADDDCEAAFQSVASSLRGAGLVAPKALSETSNGKPRVSIWLMPDCSGPGMLEDVCLESVACDAATSCVQAFVECLALHESLPNHVSKCRMQAFLASRAEPGKRLGEAAQAGYWPYYSPAFEPLRKFIERAF